jgi:hypothetical protein
MKSGRAHGRVQCLLHQAESISDELHRAGPWSLVMGVGSPICDGTDPDTFDFWLNEARTVGLR